MACASLSPRCLLVHPQLLLDHPDLDPDGTHLHEVYERLQEIDADGAVTRAGVILAGLGFDKTMMDKATKEFSGGWRMRIALAQALFCEPDLLLVSVLRSRVVSCVCVLLATCAWCMGGCGQYWYVSVIHGMVTCLSRVAGT